MQPTFERKPGKRLYTPREGMHCAPAGFGGYLQGPRSAGAPWDPTQDAGDATLLLLPGNYNGAGTWADVSGGGNHAVTGSGTDPGIPGDSLGADFDGTQWFVVPMSLADDVSYPGAALAGPQSGSIIVGYSQTVNEVDGGDYFNQAAISGDGATPGIYMTDAGAKCVGYDGIAYKAAIIGSPAAAAWHQVMGKWDTTGLYCTYDGIPWAGVAQDFFAPPANRLSVGNIGPTTYIGRSYSNNLTGTIRYLAVYPYPISNAKRLQWYNWAQANGLFS